MDFFEKHEISRPSRPYTERDFNSRIPRYNDDSDYTTNAPSYYDDLARKNKLLKTLSYRIWEYQEVINKQFNEWDEQIKEYFLEWQKNLEEFDEEVMKLLRQWMEDGTMADLINKTLLNMKADKEYVDDELARVDNELSKKADKSKLELNIKDYGAVGDGVTDDRQALLDTISAVSNKGGGIVKFPAGHYMLSGEFTIPDRVHIKGEGRATIIEHVERGVLFRTDGTYTDRVAVTQHSVLGDNFVTVSDTSNYKPGDYIRIMSQRPATDNTIDTDFQLGHATAESHKVYFGEIRKISAITGKQLFFRGGLMYPTYNAHNVGEVHPNARQNSTVDKVNYVDSPAFSDLTFKGNIGTAMRLSVAKFAEVNNCYWYDAEDGDMIAFRECYMSEGYKSVLIYNPNVQDGGTYSRNGLKTVSSWNSGFNMCQVHNGTQSVDFTYSTNGETIPNIGSYFKNGKIVGALFNSITAHGGTDLTQIKDNIMLACHRNGIGSRSRNAIITGNTIVGGANLIQADSTMGISVEQAGAVNNIIQGNIIKQFLIGIRLHDVLDSRIRKVNLMIKDNNISKVNRGIQLRRNPGSDFTGSAYVYIEGNIMSDFIGEFGKAVDIYDHINNVHFKNNSIQGNESINGGFYSRGNSHNFTIIGNQFLNSGRHIWLENSDAVQPTVWLFDNTFSPVFEGNSMLSNFRRLTPYLYGSLQPINDGVFSLGWSDRKFDRIFLAQAPVVASDKRLKEQIKPISLGLDFVKKLNPVNYKLKEKEGSHYGLIAQEVEQILIDTGVNVDDISLVKHDKDSDVYTMQYEELIPIILKAIKELNDKIN